MSLSGGDSKIIEEKLDAVSDLKTQVSDLNTFKFGFSTKGLILCQTTSYTDPSAHQR